MRTALWNEITRFVKESAENRFPESGKRYFKEPLIGFASADDPIFREYKRIIGDFHLLPKEFFDNASTVVSWALPVTAETITSNRKEKRWPSSEWSFTRSFGENFNSMLRKHVVEWLETLGHKAVAPQLTEEWRQFDDLHAGITSTWSERHAAYAAGLGTFSLNDALITQAGIAHRLGSVITDLCLEATERNYSDYRENCLWYSKNSCGACISRCPAGAISPAGHDKAKCRDYVYGIVPEAVGKLYGVPQTGCGLCQTGVPCEAGIPAGRKAESTLSL